VTVPPDTTAVDSTVGTLALSPFLTELNHRISTRLDRDRQIGHAFLLSDDVPVDSAEQLSAAFYHDIVPLLEDYALGDVNVLARLLGNDLVDSASGQVLPLDPEPRRIDLVDAHQGQP
jgi:5-methylcytosine-specific restriction enzyme B